MARRGRFAPGCSLLRATRPRPTLRRASCGASDSGMRTRAKSGACSVTRIERVADGHEPARPSDARRDDAGEWRDDARELDVAPRFASCDVGLAQLEFDLLGVGGGRRHQTSCERARAASRVRLSCRTPLRRSPSAMSCSALSMRARRSPADTRSPSSANERNRSCPRIARRRRRRARRRAAPAARREAAPSSCRR